MADNEEGATTTPETGKTAIEGGGAPGAMPPSTGNGTAPSSAVPSTGPAPAAAPPIEGTGSTPAAPSQPAGTAATPAAPSQPAGTAATQAAPSQPAGTAATPAAPSQPAGTAATPAALSQPAATPTAGTGTAPVVEKSAGVAAPSVEPYDRPAFLNALSNAYSERGKSVTVLTGATHDLFWCKKQDKFLELEQSIYQALSGIFTVLRLDIATGIDFYDPQDLNELSRVCAGADKLAVLQSDKMGELKEQIALTRHSPLPALVLLQEILTGVANMRRSNKAIKPVCTVIQFAGAIFPAGDFDHLAELDRQRLVTFLNMIEAPWFKSSDNLIILIADTRSEVNGRIVALPSVQCVEIELPNEAERSKFVSTYSKNDASHANELFEKGSEAFVVDTAGLTLSALQDLLEVARRSKTPISRKEVLSEINTVMKADLGDIINISRPEHKPSDIVGYQKAGEIFMDIFRRCENPQTAVPAILVSGPNGAGKTFQLEAYASESGRVVIELAGLRGMYFGQTETFFEKLRLRLKTYGKILILVDEAHTQFGSVHKSDTHETEKRLAGNIIKLMGDRSLFGKVLWGLMTSRPDELDPDVKSRAPIQIPIFDLEGEERRQFITELFKRKEVPIPDNEVDEVLEKTENYSARDYDFLVKEVKGSGRTSILQTLEVWQASSAILRQRRLQTLLAAQHCSYPALLPKKLRLQIGTELLDQEVLQLKSALYR